MKSLRRFQKIPKQEDVGRRLYLLKLLWLLLLLVRRNILVDTRLATQAFQIILLTEQLAQIYRCVCRLRPPRATWRQCAGQTCMMKVKGKLTSWDHGQRTSRENRARPHRSYPWVRRAETDQCLGQTSLATVTTSSMTWAPGQTTPRHHPPRALHCLRGKVFQDFCFQHENISGTNPCPT